eukprot:g7566.t1
MDKEQTPVILQFRAVGAIRAPDDKWKKRTVRPSQRFVEVINFLKRKLQFEPNDQLFIYVGEYFCPSLDEEVGVLCKAYGDSSGVLLLNYAAQEMFG